MPDEATPIPATPPLSRWVAPAPSDPLGRTPHFYDGSPPSLPSTPLSDPRVAPLHDESHPPPPPPQWSTYVCDHWVAPLHDGSPPPQATVGSHPIFLRWVARTPAPSTPLKRPLGRTLTRWVAPALWVTLRLLCGHFAVTLSQFGITLQGD